MIEEINFENLQKKDIQYLIEVRGNEQIKLFSEAKKRKNKNVYIRAVIEASNHCRQNCLFCGMRRDNKELERFRIESEIISSLVDEALSYSDISNIHFSFGEDWKFDFQYISNEIKKVYSNGKSVNLVLGELPTKTYQNLYDAAYPNKIRYTLKLETTNKEFFRKIKGGWDFEKRYDRLQTLESIGFDTCTGIIVGLPNQTIEMVADDLIFLRENCGQLSNISASPFIPSPGSPYESKKPGSVNNTLNVMAIMRIMYGENVTIPASGALGKEKQKIALENFSNLLSIHFMPEKYKDKYIIYNGKDRNFGKLNNMKQMIDELKLNIMFTI